MSVLPFLAVSLGSGTLSLLTRRFSGFSFVIGVFGLATAAAVAAITIVPGETVSVAGGAIATSDYQRVFLALGCGSSAVVCLLGLTGGWQPNLPGASLVAFGFSALALALPDPVAGITATVVVGLVGALVCASVPVTLRALDVGARELRTVAVAGALGMLAAAWADRPLGPLATEPVVFGLSYLAIAIAVAVRFGAIPFHVWAARVADGAPELGLPLLMAWGPAVFAVVGLAWVNAAIAPLTPVPLALPLERGLVLAIALASLLLGAFAAWIQDDIEHVVGYSIVQDAAFVILAFAALDGASSRPALTWVLVFVLVKTAFAGWALAMRRRFGTRRIRELQGWARRAPLLTAGLVIIALATVGWPGLTSYEARMALVHLTSDGPLGWLFTLGALVALAYYARLLVVGLGTPGAAVRAAVDDRPRRPAIPARRPAIPARRPAIPARRPAIPARRPAQSAFTERRPESGPGRSLGVRGRAGPLEPGPRSSSAADRSSRANRSGLDARTQIEALMPGAGHWLERAGVLVDRTRGWLERARVWRTEAVLRAKPVLGPLGRSSRRVAAAGSAGAQIIGSAPRLVGPAIALNQALLASVLVLALASMAFVAAAGGWGVASAATASAR